MLPSQEQDVRISSLKCHQDELLPCQEFGSNLTKNHRIRIFINTK